MKQPLVKDLRDIITSERQSAVNAINRLQTQLDLANNRIVMLETALRDLVSRVSNDRDAKSWFIEEQIAAFKILDVKQL